MKKQIAVSAPVLGCEEVQALKAVVESGWLTMGDRVAEFEHSFASLHGMPAAVAANSCTAALHLALLSLGIGQGAEVLVPSLSFVATANAVLYAGAQPVFVDIESLEVPHLSIKAAESCLSAQTRAVIVMHYGGYVVDLKAWRSFADKHRLLLVEDAAHAPAAEGVGTLSDAAAFSFFSNKNMSTAEGGMLLSPHWQVIDKARRLRAHGMTVDTLDRHRGHAFSYDVTLLGFNYRMDELRAALGTTQLKHLAAWNQVRRDLTSRFRELLSRVHEVTVPFTPSYPTAAHLMPVLLPPYADRPAIMKTMRAEGIQTSIHYPPIHTFSYYRSTSPQKRLPKTEEYSSRELTLPLHPLLTQEDQSHIVGCLAAAIVKHRNKQSHR